MPSASASAITSATIFVGLVFLHALRLVGAAEAALVGRDHAEVARQIGELVRQVRCDSGKPCRKMIGSRVRRAALRDLQRDAGVSG
jgi:pyrimidine deaminase RibD-like protein